MQKDKRIAPKPFDTERTLGRSLPASLDAERSVLASLLLNDENIPLAAEIITAPDFYHHPHKFIFQALIDLNRTGHRIDLITLQDELVKRDQLETIGGIVYLISLQEDLPAIGFVEQHAQIIKAKSMLRELINSAAHIITNCYAQNDENIDAVLDEAEKVIFQISGKRSSQSFVQLNIWLKKTFKHLSELKSHSKGITGIPSGYKKLDQMTSGFQKGDFVVLAARPSMGKTALALTIAAHAASNAQAVGFFSLEMSAEQLTLRLLSSESGIAHHNIRNLTITSEDFQQLTKVAGNLGDLKLFIDDSAMLDIMDLRAKARKLKSEQNLQLLVVDYLQLIHSNKRHENRHQEVSEISRSLKALAKELEIPVIALSQLSRAVDSRMDKRPMLSDLRESGAIEQDADLIMFLYRESVYNQEAENPALAELIIGKQRNGPTGTVYLHFAKEQTKFEDFDD